MDISVRVGPRARHVRLVVTPRDGLVVVVPSGFDRSRIPAILDEKRGWIERAWSRVEDHRRRLALEPPRLPDRILLPAVNEEWDVEYRSTPARARGVSVGSIELDLRLVVRSRGEEAEWCRQALTKWLAVRARAAFVPRLTALAAEHDLAFERVTIRHQRTRWGSCSRRGTISLNARLLFLPPELVDYVLLHELCHTVEMNHSPRFWHTLEAHHPGAVDCRRRLRTAGELVPTWLDYPLDGTV